MSKETSGIGSGGGTGVATSVLPPTPLKHQRHERWWYRKGGTWVFTDGPGRGLVEEISRRYTAGERQTKISRDMGLDSRRVAYALDRLEITKHEHRLYPLTNERAFSIISEESAYWAGFIMGDGSIGHDRNGIRSSVKIGLAIVDVAHLTKFLHFVGSDTPMYVSTSGFGKRFQSMAVVISSRLMVADLARFGVLPRKTHRAEVYLLENNRHFWRGLVDADGSIGIYKHGRHGDVAQFSVVGPEPIISQFSEYLKRQFHGYPMSVRRHAQTDVIRTIQLSNRIARSVIKLLYGDATVYLDRKMEIARRILEWRPPRRRDLLGSLLVPPTAGVSAGL